MLVGLQNIEVWYPLFGIPEKTQQSEHAKLSRGFATLAEADLLVGAASAALPRLGLTCLPQLRDTSSMGAWREAAESTRELPEHGLGPAAPPSAD